MHIAAIVYILLATLVVAAQCCWSKSKSELVREEMCKIAELDNKKKLSKLPRKLIVGGTEALLGDIPWQVNIQLLGRSDCGGSIISNDFIITAAHCSEYNPSYYLVVAGTVNLLQPGSTHIVTEIHTHHGYDSDTSENDISIWKISPPFSFDANTKAINLPVSETCTPEGTLMTASGWGRIKEYDSRKHAKNPKLPLRLLKVEVPIVSKLLCHCRYSEKNVNIFIKSQLCAGYDSGEKDSCEGDSGGPLSVGEELRGVVSFGWGCARPLYSGVYTEVSAYRMWIKMISGV